MLSRNRSWFIFISSVNAEKLYRIRQQNMLSQYDHCDAEVEVDFYMTKKMGSCSRRQRGISDLSLSGQIDPPSLLMLMSINSRWLQLKCCISYKWAASICPAGLFLQSDSPRYHFRQEAMVPHQYLPPAKIVVHNSQPLQNPKSLRPHPSSSFTSLASARLAATRA